MAIPPVNRLHREGHIRERRGEQAAEDQGESSVAIQSSAHEETSENRTLPVSFGRVTVVS